MFGVCFTQFLQACPDRPLQQRTPHQRLRCSHCPELTDHTETPGSRTPHCDRDTHVATKTIRTHHKHCCNACTSVPAYELYMFLQQHDGLFSLLQPPLQGGDLLLLLQKLPLQAIVIFLKSLTECLKGGKSRENDTVQNDISTLLTSVSSQKPNLKYRHYIYI